MEAETNERETPTERRRADGLGQQDARMQTEENGGPSRPHRERADERPGTDRALSKGTRVAAIAGS